MTLDTRAAAAPPSGRTPQAFIEAFLRAFENLDMAAFAACFAEDATVFFPAPEPPLRAHGRAEIRRRFENVFAAIRAGAPGGPPYHRLEPDTLLVQPLGEDAAVVTLHLRNAERTARRSFVLQRRAGAWSIVHLHASNGPPVN